MLSPIIEIFHEELTLPRKPFRECVQGHVPNKHSSHVCSVRCLKNLPLQTCGNVCGVTVCILASIACVAPILWRQVFLDRKENLPEDVKWLMSPSAHSDFLRCSIISWLIGKKVDTRAIGISPSEAYRRVRRSVKLSCSEVDDNEEEANYGKVSFTSEKENIHEGAEKNHFSSGLEKTTSRKKQGAIM